MAAGKVKLQEIFSKYATIQHGGQSYMTTDVFIHIYLDVYNNKSSDKQRKASQYISTLLSNVVSKTQPGLISFAEFEQFEKLLLQPDAIYIIIFQLFDTNRDGQISYQEFIDVAKQTENYHSIPSTVHDSKIINLYFGAKNDRELSYGEFCQFLHDFDQEFIQALFEHVDKNWSDSRTISGMIQIQHFHEMMTVHKGYLISPIVAKYLLDLAATQSFQLQGTKNSFGMVSYSFYSSFNQLLKQMSMIKLLYLNHTNGSKTKFLSAQDFLGSLNLNKNYNCHLDVTPSEIELLFALVGLIRAGQEKANVATGKKKDEHVGQVQYSDLALISPDYKLLSKCERQAMNKKPGAVNRTVWVEIMENAYRFFLGAIAGVMGAMAVYPIDMVKTRMQNQRLEPPKSSAVSTAAAATTAPQHQLYKHSFDCGRQILKKEGIRGLYRGVGVQLVGVAPEKALKLGINDFLRDKFTDTHTCSIGLPWEILAGAIAGTCQVVITNPLEIVKIRLQTFALQHPPSATGEPSKIPRPSPFAVIKELGFKGLYKGARACMLRDSMFTSTYFSSYSNIKAEFEDESGYNSPITLLASGVLAGIPASSIATPADVIKTRLQVVPKKGETVYYGVTHAARTIYREEGLKAFFKGLIPRVARSSPQFGITIFGYELLQRYCYIDFGGKPPKGSVPRKKLLEINEQMNRNKMQKGAKNLESYPTDSTIFTEDTQEDRIGGYKYAPQLFNDIQTKFGFRFVN